MYHIPPQKLKDYEKTPQWYRANVDGFINIAAFYHDDRRRKLKNLYDAMNGYVNSEHYNTFLHFGKLNNKKFPAQIRNFPIISPVIYRLIGEKRARPFIYNVLALNSDVESLQQEEWKKELVDYGQKVFVLALSKQGKHPGFSVEALETPQEFEKRFKRKWKDGRALAAQHVLNYIVKNEDVFNKVMLMFFDWCTAGEAYSYKEPRLQHVQYDRVNPLNVDFDLDPDAVLIQDADWFIQRKFSHTATVIDKYSEKLTDDEITSLENPVNSGIDIQSGVHNNNPFWRRYDRLVEEVHVVWKSRKYRGRVIYLDEMNKKVIEEVDPKFNIQQFKNQLIMGKLNQLTTIRQGEIAEEIKQGILQELPEPESSEQEAQQLQEAQMKLDEAIIEIQQQEVLSPEEIQQTVDYVNKSTSFSAYWDNTICQGVRLDNNIYVNLEEIPTTYGHPIKLPYNGRVYANINSDPISLVSVGMPFQINYNIFKYRLELSIARSKDVIAVFDINMIPKKWDMDKWNHYLEGTGIAWVDFSKEGIKPNPNMQSVMDLSVKIIDQYINLLEYTVSEWERVSGVSRQRQGDITQNDGLGSAQTAIQQSTYVTEEMFSRFDELIAADFQGLIECGKYTYAGGKKLTYITSEGLAAYYDLKQGELEDAEIGVFVYNGTDELRKLQEAKMLTERLAQQGTAPVSMLLDIIGAESYAQLKNKVQDIEEIQQQLAQAQERAVSEQEQSKNAIEEAKLALDREKLDREDANKQLDRINKIELKRMDIDSTTFALDANNNNVPDAVDLERMQIERTKTMASVAATDYKTILDSIKESNKREIDNKKLAFEQNKLKTETALKIKELDIKEQDMKIKLQIAKENKNKYD